MLQLALDPDVKDQLRQSFDDLIGFDALNKEMPAGNEAARESAIRGQNSSSIGKQGNEIYGGVTIRRIFSSVSEKFINQEVRYHPETHRFFQMVERIADGLTEAAKAAAVGLDAFKAFLDAGGPRH